MRLRSHEGAVLLSTATCSTGSQPARPRRICSLASNAVVLTDRLCPLRLAKSQPFPFTKEIVVRFARGDLR
jgi:hypothetical protein